MDPPRAGGAPGDAGAGAPADPAAPPGFDAFCGSFLMQLPPGLAASFDRRQLFAVWQAFGPWQGHERRRGRHFRLRLPGRSWRVSIADAGPDEATAIGPGATFVMGILAGGAATMLIRMAVS